MIEICCGSYEDALNAYYGGAKRIELNSALYLGGLTPSVASLKLIKETTDLKVICMVRPRGGGFCYSDSEFKQLLGEAKDLLENGADGLAFGFLRENREIDLEKTKILISLIKDYKKEAVFHRAYDCVTNPYTSIELLIDLGVDRLLTSGLQEKAFDGKELIRELQEKYGSSIELLVGSGINASNARAIKEYTGVTQLHSSCKDWQEDPTTSGDHVNYCYGPTDHKNEFEIVNRNLVENLVTLDL